MSINFHAPKWAGRYVIGDSLNVSVRKKPNVVHRFFVRAILGWKWEDNK